jgi:hypothetical protein
LKTYTVLEDSKSRERQFGWCLPHQLRGGEEQNLDEYVQHWSKGLLGHGLESRRIAQAHKTALYARECLMRWVLGSAEQPLGDAG